MISCERRKSLPVIEIIQTNLIFYVFVMILIIKHKTEISSNLILFF